MRVQMSSPRRNLVDPGQAETIARVVHNIWILHQLPRQTLALRRKAQFQGWTEYGGAKPFESA